MEGSTNASKTSCLDHLKMDTMAQAMLYELHGHPGPTHKLAICQYNFFSETILYTSIVCCCAPCNKVIKQLCADLKVKAAGESGIVGCGLTTCATVQKTHGQCRRYLIPP